MKSEVDLYLEEGCGRCSYYQTPQCKVHSFPNELRELRKIVLETELQEEYKWSQPCYVLGKKNVLIITAFKNYAAISFFKGSLLNDPEGLLVKPGESSQAGRFLKFTSVKEIRNQLPQIRDFINQAIEIERSGKKVEFKKNPEPVPAELKAKFKEMPDLKKAFEALTPGRQRGYIIHFSQPKKPETRISRIEKCIPKIMDGKGFHDR